jgi:hypothetical protein
MERATGNESKAARSESEAKAHDQRAPAADDAHKTPKKRRKVNHGELLVAPLSHLAGPRYTIRSLT